MNNAESSPSESISEHLSSEHTGGNFPNSLIKRVSSMTSLFTVLESTKRLSSCSISDFDLSSTCGTGSFARVRLARFKLSSEYFAIKILKKESVVRLKQVEHVKSEKRILRGLCHPFIVSLHGTFQDAKKLYFVLEYVPGGEFFPFLRRKGILPEYWAVFYSAQLVLVFEYLHMYKIAYRDLKPENLLISLDGYLKLTDFGFSKFILNYSYTLCGTPEYMAPEILLNQGHSTSVDWWSLGILIYEMLCGHPPFISDTTIGIYQKIVACRLCFPRQLSRDAKFLMKSLITPDLTKRYGNLKNGINDIKNSPFYSSIVWGQLIDRKIIAPYIPPHSPKVDTSNFEAYPESNEESETESAASESLNKANVDVFVNW